MKSKFAGSVALLVTGILSPALWNATAAEAEKLVAGPMPRTILRDVTRSVADVTVANLEATSARAEVKIVPTGPDIARGWGRRRSGCCTAALA